MEGELQNSPVQEYPVDSDAEIDGSKLSALLVATIQEAKDRISEVEHMFCCQLYPDYQSKSLNLHNVYSEARKDAEDAMNVREKDLLLQIETLQSEKQHALEENQALRLEKLDFEKFVCPSSKCINDLREDLKRKTTELAEGRELQNKLVQLIQSNATSLLHKDKLLKEHEEKTTKFLVKIKSLEEKVDELEVELRSRTNQVEKGKEVNDNLVKRIELEVANNEQLLKDCEKEKNLLTTRLESLEDNVKELQEELIKKTEEVEEGKYMQEQLRQKNDLNGLELLKSGQELEELQKEKNLQMAKVEVLEEKIDKLQSDLRERSIESTEGMELHKKLLQQMETKDLELSSEKKKRRSVIDSYKRLKSQYNFLCARNGLTPENMLPLNKAEDGQDSTKRNLSPLTSPDIGNKVFNTSVVKCELVKQHDNQDSVMDNQRVGLNQRSSLDSPSSSSSPVSAQCHATVKSGSLVGTKRPASHWRETRSHQNRGGPDPHDDFFNTPIENIRGNTKKATKEEIHDFPDPVPKDMTFHSSDDETQDLHVDPGPAPQKQQMPPLKPGTKGFKYVEPVRKKTEREALKGVECKQCKKFYDAVLPDGGGKDGNGTKHNLRCEHHDGVSRHRYRFVPPSTPEGFWNIGFESEI